MRARLRAHVDIVGAAPGGRPPGRIQATPEPEAPRELTRPEVPDGPAGRRSRDPLSVRAIRRYDPLLTEEERWSGCGAHSTS